jgi:hypothetical protein
MPGKDVLKVYTMWGMHKEIVFQMQKISFREMLWGGTLITELSYQVEKQIESSFSGLQMPGLREVQFRVQAEYIPR